AVGQARLGVLVDVGPAPYHHRGVAPDLRGLSRDPPDHGQSVAAGSMGGGDRDRRVHRRSDRAPVGRVVAFAAPGADGVPAGWARDRGDDAARAPRRGRRVHDRVRVPDDAAPPGGAARGARRARGAVTARRGRALMAPNAGYVIAAYLVTALALGGYTLRLFARARTAKRGARTIADRRRHG